MSKILCESCSDIETCNRPKNASICHAYYFKPIESDLKNKPFSEMTFREGVAFELLKSFIANEVGHSSGNNSFDESVECADRFIKALAENKDHDLDEDVGDTHKTDILDASTITHHNDCECSKCELLAHASDCQCNKPECPNTPF